MRITVSPSGNGCFANWRSVRLGSMMSHMADLMEKGNCLALSLTTTISRPRNGPNRREPLRVSAMSTRRFSTRTPNQPLE